MRENHPYFDRPLFLVGRDSQLRKFCFKVVNARYSQTNDYASNVINSNKTGSGSNKKYKQI